MPDDIALWQEIHIPAYYLVQCPEAVERFLVWLEENSDSIEHHEDVRALVHVYKWLPKRKKGSLS